MTPSPTFESDSDAFWLGGIRFCPTTGSSGVVTGEDGVALLKPWVLIESEFADLADVRVSRMLELGVFQGGSAVLWSLLLPLTQFIGVDLRPLDSIRFPDSVRADPRWDRIELVGRTSQDDHVAMGAIVDQFDGPLDLVVDDASHQYGLTRRSFEICFPRVRPGGVYVIEDWSWADLPGPWTDAAHPWHGRPTLANLVMRLVSLLASRRDIISGMVVRPNYVAVHRGPAILGHDFDIETANRSPHQLTEIV